jgi:hypothetical protein
MIAVASPTQHCRIPDHEGEGVLLMNEQLSLEYKFKILRDSTKETSR